MTIKTDDFIMDICASLDDPEGKQYLKVLRIALREMRNFKTFLVSNIKGIKVVVESNFSAPMPEDCIYPIQMGKYVRMNNQDFIYPLGNRKDLQFRTFEMTPPKKFSCPQNPEDYESMQYWDYEWYGAQNRFWYLGSYYGEEYGYKQTRFFGWWTWNEDDHRIEFDVDGCLSEGDFVAVRYRAHNSEVQEFDSFIEEPLRNKILAEYFRPSNPTTSAQYFDMFRRSYRMYKHQKVQAGHEEILDAITSGYSSAVR